MRSDTFGKAYTWHHTRACLTCTAYIFTNIIISLSSFIPILSHISLLSKQAADKPAILVYSPLAHVSEEPGNTTRPRLRTPSYQVAVSIVFQEINSSSFIFCGNTTHSPDSWSLLFHFTFRFRTQFSFFIFWDCHGLAPPDP